MPYVFAVRLQPFLLKVGVMKNIACLRVVAAAAGMQRPSRDVIAYAHYGCTITDDDELRRVVNVRGQFGETILSSAILCGCDTFAILLLKLGADPLAEDGGYPPLFFAILYDALVIVQLLIETYHVPYRHCFYVIIEQLDASKGRPVPPHITAYFARIDTRIECATLAAPALLSRGSKRHWGRDIARILARLVWCTRRWDAAWDL